MIFRFDVEIVYGSDYSDCLRVSYRVDMKVRPYNSSQEPHASKRARIHLHTIIV